MTNSSLKWAFTAVGMALFTGGCAYNDGPQITPEDVAEDLDSKECTEVTFSKDQYKARFDTDCADAQEMAYMFQSAYELLKERGDPTLLFTLVRHWNEQNEKFEDSYEQTVIKQLEANGWDLNGKGLEVLNRAVQKRWECVSDDVITGQTGVKCYQRYVLNEAFEMTTQSPDQSGASLPSHERDAGAPAAPRPLY